MSVFEMKRLYAICSIAQLRISLDPFTCCNNCSTMNTSPQSNKNEQTNISTFCIALKNPGFVFDNKMRISLSEKTCKLRQVRSLSRTFFHKKSHFQAAKVSRMMDGALSFGFHPLILYLIVPKLKHERIRLMKTSVFDRRGI